MNYLFRSNDLESTLVKDVRVSIATPIALEIVLTVLESMHSRPPPSSPLCAKVSMDRIGHPELTGGMIATSSPSLKMISLLLSASSRSMYSRFTVIAQLERTLSFMPG